MLSREHKSKSMNVIPSDRSRIEFCTEQMMVERIEWDNSKSVISYESRKLQEELQITVECDIFDLNLMFE